MTPNIYNPKIHNKKLLVILLAAAIAAMFLIRGILYQNGTLESMQTLSPEKLEERISGYEVQIAVSAGSSAAENTGNTENTERAENGSSGDGTVRFGGTILDGRKQSTRDENFTLTIVTAVKAVQSGDSGQASGDDLAAGQNSGNDPAAGIGSGQEEESSGITVTLPDGTEAEGTVLYVDGDAGIAFVQCLCPSEIEAYYSRDILERLEAGDAVYAYEAGALEEGRLIAEGQILSGIGSDLMVADFGAAGGEDTAQAGTAGSSNVRSTTTGGTGSSVRADILPGSGLYGTSGNYLGMILQNTDGGQTACVSAVDIVRALNQEL